MWGIIHRAILPLFVLAMGVAALVYGVDKHTLHVFVEKEIEIPLPSFGPPGMPPGMPPGVGGPPGMAGMPGFPGPPGGMPPFGSPPPELQKIKQKIFEGKNEPETVIVRDVTIGGLVLTDKGDLRRTYSGAPPSLCPT